MISYINANIEDVEADVIVNAANAQGYMGGFIGKYIKFPGVAESIHYKDQSIEIEAKLLCKTNKINVGEVFVTNSGSLRCKKIFHAVTMNKPGEKSNLQVVTNCINNIAALAKELQFKTIAIPLLGAGTGKVNAVEVERLIVDNLKEDDEILYLIVKRKFN